MRRGVGSTRTADHPRNSNYAEASFVYSRTTLRFKTCKSFYQTNSHVGIPNLASNRSKSHFWIQNVDFPSSNKI
jgi:hypothetical protein